MASLLETQRCFTQSLRGVDPDAAEALIAPGRFGVARHLNVYRHNVESSLRSALAAIYPVVERLVGDGFFRFLSAQYLREHPSKCANLHDLGEHLAEFLRTFEPARSLAYLPDVACLEWAWHRVFHAADAPPMSADAITAALAADAGALRGRLHPATRLLESPYPILRIWEVNQTEGSDETVDLTGGGECLLVRRVDLEVEVHRLSPGDFGLLDALARGESLITACAAALALEPDLDIAPLLQRHLTQGVIVEIYRLKGRRSGS